jgi:hypothetical protein
MQTSSNDKPSLIGNILGEEEPTILTETDISSSHSPTESNTNKEIADYIPSLQLDDCHERIVKKNSVTNTENQFEEIMEHSQGDEKR